MPLNAGTVLEAKLLPEGDGSDAVDGDHEYTRHWQCFAGDDLATEAEVLASSLLPQNGDLLAKYAWTGTAYAVDVVADPHSAVANRRARRDPEHPRRWTVEVGYRGISDPLARPKTVDYGEVPYQEQTIQDPTGRVIANVVGDPYDGGVPRDAARQRVTITQFVAYKDWNPLWSEDYRNTLNAFPFYLPGPKGPLTDASDNPIFVEPGVVKIASLTASQVERTPNPDSKLRDYVWEVRAVVELDNATFVNNAGQKEKTLWRHVLVEQGYQELYDGPPLAAGTVVKRPIFLNGRQPTSPQLLDEQGRALKLPGVPPAGTSGGLLVPGGPTAGPVSYVVAKGGTLTVAAPGLKALAPGAVSVSKVVDASEPSAAAGGEAAVAVNSDGSFTYTPPAGFVGYARFTYKGTNTAGDSGPASVTILVGDRPRFTAWDRYESKDWTPIMNLLGAW